MIMAVMRKLFVQSISRFNVPMGNVLVTKVSVEFYHLALRIYHLGAQTEAVLRIK